MWTGQGVFIGPKSNGRLVLGVYIRVLLHNGPKATSYVQVLSSG